MRTNIDGTEYKNMHFRKNENEEYVPYKKVYVNGKLFFSAGNIVTYIVDGAKYTEEVESGQSCLSPKNFTPRKTGCIFLGWSESAYSATILPEKVMDSDPITLYAVFQYNGGTITQTISQNQDTVKTTITMPSNAEKFQWRIKGTDGNNRTVYINPHPFTSGLNTADSSDALKCDGHWTGWSTVVYTAAFTLTSVAYNKTNMVLTIEKSYTGKTVVG